MNLPADYVLLTNAQPDKGYDFILKVAALLPEVPFLVIASQSPRDDAVQAAEAAGLDNVTVIERVADMAPLYAGALAAAVPSYRFRESFSRVCIEAQRAGVPVIGSDRGNLPYLLAESGVSLPPDPALWAAEIEKLRADEAYRAERSRRGRANAARYTIAEQRAVTERIVAAAQAPFLVAVGSGLGNMLHTTPMIRAIARHLGHPVDVVVAEDHARSLYLMHRPEYVNAVHSLTQTLLRRVYDCVFVTHSFGPARLPFKGRRVAWSRDWDNFSPAGMHETLFNLEAAKRLLGVPYTDEDAQGYFCGDLAWSAPAQPLIGMHAGSKAGNWTVKRWPHFPALAGRLTANGLRVASFGTADEYVEGTENRTGATIAAMCEAMTDCSHFVANDSGVMNIASALGIPTLALFAPTNAATRLPLRATTQAIVLEKDCAPCEIKDVEGFMRGQCRCMEEIGVDLVERRLLAMMA
ncbi:MAG: glycosyltransferase [Alphaproteobacteria bacterium]|nr:glycosyltransferase [Alphaproteobacteria bacterium]MBV9694222.1 glycosyltransferase [Alphaproteobacteria bacterium]